MKNNGATAQTPLEVCLPQGETAYLDRLRCPDGQPPTVTRIGVAGFRNKLPPGETPPTFAESIAGDDLKRGGTDVHTIDQFKVTCGTAKPKLLHFDMYHCGAPPPEHAPPGLSLGGAPPRDDKSAYLESHRAAENQALAAFKRNDLPNALTASLVALRLAELIWGADGSQVADDLVMAATIELRMATDKPPPPTVRQRITRALTILTKTNAPPKLIENLRLHFAAVLSDR